VHVSLGELLRTKSGDFRDQGALDRFDTGRQVVARAGVSALSELRVQVGDLALEPPILSASVCVSELGIRNLLESAAVALVPASSPRLLPLARASRVTAGEHLSELAVDLLLLEEGALLAADLVRDRGRLAPVLVGELVRRLTVLQKVHL
jgi:hypothetical protein